MLKQTPHCLCFRIYGAKRRILLSVISLSLAILFSILWAKSSGYTAALFAFDTFGYSLGAIACLAYNMQEARRWWREGCDKKHDDPPSSEEESPV